MIHGTVCKSLNPGKKLLHVYICHLSFEQLNFSFLIHRIRLEKGQKVAIYGIMVYLREKRETLQFVGKLDT